uniref:F-box domain-containing protein n=1 Tax=Caenorhabditis tropicalis TaxID=1561998 RepID=A0A1I7UGR6_9PELO
MSWATLPVDFKQKVVQKLDLMSRYALKSVSHLDELIVNSIEFRIPRVRFGFKDERCLLMIYTGIRKFLRIELSQCKEGTIIHRSENSWNPNDIFTKLIPLATPLEQGISILQSLLSDGSVILEVMEWESKNEDFEEEVSRMITRRLRVQNIVFTQGSARRVKKQAFDAICFTDELKAIEMIGLGLSTGNLNPVASCICVYNVQGTPLKLSRYFMNYNEDEWNFFVTGCRTVKKSRPEDHPVWCHSRLYLSKNPPKYSFDRKEREGAISRTTRSKCGEWTYTMTSREENTRLKDLETEKCGLGALCKTCASPFDYWYHRNLPLHLIQEPFWTGVVEKKGILPEHEMKMLKTRLEKDEEMKEKCRKKTSVKTTPSWGFRSAPIQNVLLMTAKGKTEKNQEKKNKKKMFNLKRKEIRVEVKKEVEKPIQEPKKPIQEPEVPMEPSESALMLLIKSGAFGELSEQSKAGLMGSLSAEAVGRVKKIIGEERTVESSASKVSDPGSLKSLKILDLPEEPKDPEPVIPVTPIPPEPPEPALSSLTPEPVIHPAPLNPKPVTPPPLTTPEPALTPLSRSQLPAKCSSSRLSLTSPRNPLPNRHPLQRCTNPIGNPLSVI